MLVLQVPTALMGILIIALALAVAVVGVLLVHRLVPIEVRKSYSTGLGQIRGSLSPMFAIIVGFAAFLTLSNYHGAQLTVQSEAENVHEIYNLAQALPQPKREQIQGLAISYAHVVIEQEWPLRSQGRTSQRANDIAVELRRSIQDGYTTSSDAQQGIYGALLSVMDQLEEDRDTRLIVRTDLHLIL